MKLTIATIAAVAFAEGSGDPEPSSCLNDAWAEDVNGVCQPKAEHFSLKCNHDGMIVEMDQAVVPAAADISLLGNCVGSFNADSNMWTLSTKLDECSTAMSTNQDGSLSFSNTLRANSFTGNDIIFTTNSVLVSFECSYQNAYDNIEAANVNVVGSNYTTDAGDADSDTGAFSFSLVQYMDNAFSDAADSDDVTSLGDNLYFLLSMQNPVANLVYSIVECTVSDDNLGKSYPIINNQCPDTFLSVEANAQMSDATQTGIGFSYLGFQFVESADDDAAVNMRLTCSAIVCDANDNDSECAAGCQARKRREAPIGVKQYNVATQFRVLPKF